MSLRRENNDLCRLAGYFVVNQMWKHGNEKKYLQFSSKKYELRVKQFYGLAFR